MPDDASTPRSVARVVQAVRTIEGGGFAVRRPFPVRGLEFFDPFLLLDEMGPADLGPGEAKGAPDHPHRGFETVTYMLSGRMHHRDSQGAAGSIGPGDVQWMTAGAGVVHSEMPSDEILRQGGRMHGFQLWVNLPQGDKMMRPRYQEIPGERIPVAASADGRARVRVIAGEALGARAVIDTRTPISYLHVTLQPGGRFSQPVPRGHNAFVYVFGGEGVFGPDARAARDGEAVLFAADGDRVTMATTGPEGLPLEALLLTGQPLAEPVARYGPFVMNTEAEIHQAIEDFRAGRMGTIEPERG
jgi:redox-sensitive bicupin YhaK (pirin superfamily)